MFLHGSTFEFKKSIWQCKTMINGQRFEECLIPRSVHVLITNQERTKWWNGFLRTQRLLLTDTELFKLWNTIKALLLLRYELCKHGKNIYLTLPSTCFEFLNPWKNRFKEFYDIADDSRQSIPCINKKNGLENLRWLLRIDKSEFSRSV